MCELYVNFTASNAVVVMLSVFQKYCLKKNTCLVIEGLSLFSFRGMTLSDWSIGLKCWNNKDLPGGGGGGGLDVITGLVKSVLTAQKCLTILTPQTLQVEPSILYPLRRYSPINLLISLSLLRFFSN